MVIFAITLVLTTSLMVCLFVKEHYKIINGVLNFSIFVMLTFVVILNADKFLIETNIAMDYFTFTFVVYNISFLGTYTIFWQGSLLLQQIYLVNLAAFIALNIIKFFPEWATWFILVFLCVYDLIAVLCPQGPLRVLLEEAQKKDARLPGLIYMTALRFIGFMNFMSASTKIKSQNDDNEIVDNENNVITDLENDEKEADHKQSTNHDDAKTELGLGDFVFYSVLIGKVYINSNLTCALICFLSVLVGLTGTFILLLINEKALPAIPISISIGTSIYFFYQFFIDDFNYQLITNQICI